MRLRLKLVLAFFFLAVVPLAGLSVYSYYSSLEAYKKAVREETRQLADQMGTRIDTVRHDVGRRVRALVPQEFSSLATAEPEQLGPEAYSKILTQLEDVAVMLEDIELDPQVPAAKTVDPGPRPGGPPPPPPPPQEPPSLLIRLPEEPAGAVAPPDDEEIAKAIDVPGRGKVIVHRPPPYRGSHPPPGDSPRRRRREIEIHWPEQTVKALEAQARSWEYRAQQLSQAVSEAASSAERSSRPEAPSRDEGKRAGFLDLTAQVSMENNYEATLVTRINARRLLGSVLGRMERHEGEIPFAVDPEGRLYTAQPQDQEALKTVVADWTELGDTAEIPEEWIISSTKDPKTGMLFGIAKPIGAGLTEIRQAAARNLGYGLALVGVALIGILPLSGRMTRNLTVLTDGVERLGNGELSTRVPVRSKDEFGRLSAAFNRMAAQLLENQQRKIEQERMKKELELCRQIQREMLPRTPLQLPFAEIRGVSIPAREVGGDFFNYFALPDGQVVLLIGDVSGKGVPAALLMANIQATLRARLSSGENLVGIVAQLDEEIAATTPAATYLTLFICILDPSGSKLRWVNAGHNTQYLLRRKGTIERMPSSGRPVGLLPGSTCTEGSLDLETGDAIFLYTDGLVEAENSQAEEYGYERLEQILTDSERFAASEFLTRIEDEVRRHRGDCETQDDATMLMLNTARV